MSKIDDGGAAFPTHDADPGTDPRSQILSGGMSMRDYFAGQALIAHASTSEWEMLDDLAQKNLAEASYEMADAMLAARSKGEA